MKILAGNTLKHVTLLTVIISISGCLPLAPIMAAKRMSDKSSSSSTDSTAKTAPASTQTETAKPANPAQTAPQ